MFVQCGNHDDVWQMMSWDYENKPECVKRAKVLLMLTSELPKNSTKRSKKCVCWEEHAKKETTVITSFNRKGGEKKRKKKKTEIGWNLTSIIVARFESWNKNYCVGSRPIIVGVFEYEKFKLFRHELCASIWLLDGWIFTRIICTQFEWLIAHEFECGQVKRHPLLRENIFCFRPRKCLNKKNRRMLWKLLEIHLVIFHSIRSQKFAERNSKLIETNIRVKVIFRKIRGGA